MNVTAELLYEIARYTVQTDTEVLAERVQLIREEGKLWVQTDQGEKKACWPHDVGRAIVGDAALNAIQPDHITRITAPPEILQKLPFSLRATGEWGDFNESLWSESMRTHIHEDWRSNLPFDPYRVLYINEERWCTWSTNLGSRMLPADLEASLDPMWGRLGLFESGEMSSGESQSTLGLLYPSVVIETASLDAFDDVAEEYAGYLTVGIYERDGTADGDARIIVKWLLSSPLPWYFYTDSNNYVNPILFVQLFIEATLGANNGQVILGYELADATGYGLDSPTQEDSEFTLQLNVDRATIEAALDLIARQETTYEGLVTAARNPEAPAEAAPEA